MLMIKTPIQVKASKPMSRAKCFNFQSLVKKKAIMVNTLMKNMTCILLQFC